jgi:tRNA A-37 threonylcarbamoyl transferase component Bud32/streptogramin lyase
MTLEPTLPPHLSVKTDPLLGSDLAGYRLESVLGRGGMGVVYLATDLRLKRRVALKLVTPELAADPRFRKRFLREAELAASLDHSHVVPVHAAGETDGQLWIAMRYVEGEDLETLLQREGPLEPARALALIGQVGEALDAAHEHGLVHRDVKPANVLVTEEGGAEHCYLADFGLARSDAQEHVAATGAHLSGTVDYTAPEQIAAEPADRHADGYSLGCVLYECLAGEPPFHRDRPASTLYAHLEESPPSLHQHRPELPQAIDQVIATALAKNPDERYETCDELVASARETLGLGTTRTTRRRLLIGVAAAVVALAAMGGALAVALTRNGEPAASVKAIVPVTTDSVVRIDPETAKAVAAFEVGDGPRSIAIGAGSIWVANESDRTLTQIDAATSALQRTVDVSNVGRPSRLAAGKEGVWIADAGDRSHRTAIWRYDPAIGNLAAMPTEPLIADGLVYVAGSLWVRDIRSALLQLDPRTGEITARVDPKRVDMGESGLESINEGAFWSSDFEHERVVALDAAAKEVRGLALEFAPNITARVAAGKEGLWLTHLDDNDVFRVDPKTGGRIAVVGVGRDPTEIVVGGGFVWVASGRDGTVTRIDPETLDTTVVQVGTTIGSMAFGEGALWVVVDVR